MAKKDDWITLDSGVLYNRKTGAAKIPGAGGEASKYEYDPLKNQTSYNGMFLTGKYDPAILDTLTNEDLEKNSEMYEKAYVDPQIDKLSKSPFLTSEKNVTDAFNPAVNTFNHLNFAAAYSEARKRFGDQETFFGSVDNQFKETDPGNQLGAGGLGTKDVDAVLNSNYSPAVKQKMLEGYLTKFSHPDVKSYITQNMGTLAGTPTPQQPQQSQQPLQPTAPIQAAAADSKPGDTLDWKKLYEDISGTVQDFRKQFQHQSKPREQIASFQQYGPTATRQQLGRFNYPTTSQQSSKGR